MEILAVIIILAAITLITVPIVTNAVKSARKGSFKVSAQNLVKAADKYYGEHEFEMNKVSTFDFSKNDGKNEAGEELLLSGKKPISGKVVVSKQGDIVLADISDGTYYANYDSTIDDQVVITETSEVLTRDEITEQLKELQKEVANLKKLRQEDQKNYQSKMEELTANHDQDVNQVKKDLATTTAAANSANTLATILNSTRLNKTYPVGSIYISYSNTNPANLFGGTWESFGTGRTLIGIDSNQSEFNTIGKTGGEKSHLHGSFNSQNGTLAAAIGSGYQDAGSIAFLADNSTVSSRGDYRSTYKVSGTGFEKSVLFSHWTSVFGETAKATTLPPYVTVYMWRRVS